MSKRIKLLVMTGAMLGAMAVPGVASAAPADGRCVSNGVKQLRSVIPTVAPGGAVSGIILSHAFDPDAWVWCQG
jgi:hypothetical protein